MKKTIKKEAVEKVEMHKTLTGVVVSTKMQKTIRVKIGRSIMHPIYKKAVKKSSSFLVHNEGIDVREGDTVKIESTRPMSKTKHFKLVEKVTI